MKRTFTFLAISILVVAVFAQSPEKISYQAVIRNSSDQLITEQGIGVQVSILKEGPNGTPVYVETHSATTNVNGLLTIEIGGGTPITGTFSDIDWSTGIYFLKTDTDPTGGTSYSITGTSQLLSVPYALHSKTSETVTGTITESQISDLQTYLSAETDPVFTISEAASITSTDITNLGNLSGANTGDQDLSSYATKDMGNEKITNLADPVDDQDAANKAYVDELKSQIEDLQVLAGIAVKDNDGNTYKTVTIGTQVWMAENLKTTKYRNGDPIPIITDKLEWANLTDGAYCYYNNDPSFKSIYGALYNFYSVVDSRNLCPSGWHVPSDTEWETLENFMIANGYNYDGSTTGNKIGKSIASTTLWWPSEFEGAVGNTDFPDYRNLSGFNGYPGGRRNEDGEYSVMGGSGIWWSSFEDLTSYSISRNLDFANVGFGPAVHHKRQGYAIRCVKD